MQLIGRIVRLQVQVESLKRGERPYRVYSLSNLRVVPEMKLTADGVAGLDGQAEMLDVHHLRHPRSRHRPGNGISFNFTTHYGRMDHRFGPHMALGCAGENIIVETAASFDLDQLQKGLILQTSGGRQIYLDQIAVMLPCLPFSKYSLQDANPPPDVLKETLQFLDQGTRGFSGMLVGDSAVIRAGDSVYLPQ